MASRPPAELAAELLAACRAGEPWRHETLLELVNSGSNVLFSDLVEPLCDSFDPRLTNCYAELFSHVIAHLIPSLQASDLRHRFEALRRGRRPEGNPDNVVVLSRVTLGADVAVTSVALDWAKQRFPNASVWFAGPTKNYELFNADDAVGHIPIQYGRHASLAQRLQAGMALRQRLPGNAIVIDPDSRITQLGLLPVCDDDRYYFFESRALRSGTIGGGIRDWLGGGKAYIATSAEPAAPGQICISLGTGENRAKGMPDTFEAQLLRALAGKPVLIDHGAGGEEQERVDKAVAASGRAVETFTGSFASFAAAIAQARLYVGYDSSGQHVAAACGVPLVTIFAGAPNSRFIERWRPAGPGPIEVIRVAQGEAPAQVLARTLGAIESVQRASARSTPSAT